MTALHAFPEATAAVVVAVIAGLLGLALLGCYVRGVVRLDEHPQGRRQLGLRPAALGLGVAVLLTLGGSPLAEDLEDRLWTHMVQHMAFLLVVAPLLAWSAPGTATLAGCPAGLRRGLVRLGRGLRLRHLNQPALAWVACIGALWAWHLPGPYDAAVRAEPIHLLEHATFVLSAWWFWWHLVGPVRRRLPDLAGAAYVVAAIPPGSALAAVLTFPRHPLYPAQAALSRAAGLDPVADQRLGGLVMWIPMDFAFVAIAVALLYRWLRALRTRWPEGAPPVAAAWGGRP
jgi:cytochrome c oxidase assembly factor CtaG